MGLVPCSCGLRSRVEADYPDTKRESEFRRFRHPRRCFERMGIGVLRFAAYLGFRRLMPGFTQSFRNLFQSRQGRFRRVEVEATHYHAHHMHDVKGDRLGVVDLVFEISNRFELAFKS